MTTEAQMREQFEKQYAAVNHGAWFDKDNAGEYLDVAAYNGYAGYKLALSSLPSMTEDELVRMMVLIMHNNAAPKDDREQVCTDEMLHVMDNARNDAEAIFLNLRSKLPHIVKEKA